MHNKQKVLIAFLVTMGFWGYVHLIGGIARAVHYHELSQVNPYNLTRLNALTGHAGTTWWGFMLGWLVFLAGVIGVLIYLNRRERS